MEIVKRTTCIAVEVLVLVAATHGIYPDGADHYWPLNEIWYSRVYDHVGYPVQGRWHGTLKGKVEMKWSSPQLGLDLYDKDTWIDLGWRENSCYADVKYCNHTGFTISFWVAFCEANSLQRLFEFGSGDCGLNLILTNESEIAATIKSMELRKIWTIVSGNATIGVREWHHVTLTWNNTGDVYLFLNGTRLENIQKEEINFTCANASCSCDWAMKIGGLQSYSSLRFSRVIIWHYALDNKTIQDLSTIMQGLHLSNRGCGGSWIANLQFCYYINANGKQIWAEAKRICDSLLGNLVSIGSQEEYDFLEDAMKKKKVSSCLHIGLQNNTGSSEPSWVDGNVWSFSKLNGSYGEENNNNSCVHRGVDGLWYFGKCDKECGLICKKYRGNVFRNAEFRCRVRRHDHQLVHHRVSIRLVQNELACAIDCLIYGSGCKSYNYKHNYDSASNGENLCELNSSSQGQHPGSLIRNRGFQYCERVSF